MLIIRPIVRPRALPRPSHRVPLAALALGLLAAGCVSLPTRAPSIALGCEDARDGASARTVAIYARVLAGPVCVLDYRGQCRMRYAPGAVVLHPVAWSAGPPPAVLAAGLERRGLDVGIVTPRRQSRQFASQERSDRPIGSEPQVVIHLGAIEMAGDGASAVVSMHVLGPRAVRSPRVEPALLDGGTVYRLVRMDVPRGLPRRLLSPANVCWRLETSNRSALVE